MDDITCPNCDSEDVKETAREAPLYLKATFGKVICQDGLASYLNMVV